MKVLICDDDPVIRYLLKVVLGKRAGDEVIEVANADEVFEAADLHRPDLIVLDYVMPNRNGAEVVEELRTDEVLGAIPVVFLTGRSDIAEETLDEIGVAGLIEKPFDASALPDRLRAFAATRAQ
jgi:two-component system phosphate regulon response regulator PhoB